MDISQSAVHERLSKPAQKQEATRSPGPQASDPLFYLPAAKAYYPFPPPHAGHTSGRMFYASPPDVRAYAGTNAPPPTPSPATPTSSPSAQPSPCPSITQELMRCIPEASKCLEYLARAQEILTESPVEIGQWSRAAACPHLLRDKLASEVNKASGWPMVRKRVKQLWAGKRQSRPSASRNAAPAGLSTSSNPPPATIDSRTAAVPHLQPINESLPFFALACTLLAFGADPAKDSDPSDHESGTYLLALGQQALSIWIDGGERLPTPDTQRVVPDEVVKEARADYFRAHSLAIQYYLVKGSRSAQVDAAKFMTFTHPNKRQLLNLVRHLHLSPVRTLTSSEDSKGDHSACCLGS